jgi:two-component sensor histidine kinase
VPVARDVVDDLGQIALAVNRMAEAQEASIEALRQVSADIAHDLKTPIQRVAVLLDRLEGTTLTRPAREIIAAARAETAQIVETFRALLQIAQLEGGQARSGLADLDFATLVADLADVYGPASEESGHLLTTAINGPAIVKGDRTLLGRLVANLIENALRHTPPGRVLLHVAGGPSPVLTVTDEGPGIPEAEHERVFRRLYRLERSRTSERQRSWLELGRSDRGTPRCTIEAWGRESGADCDAVLLGLKLVRSESCFGLVGTLAVEMLEAHHYLKMDGLREHKEATATGPVHAYQSVWFEQRRGDAPAPCVTLKAVARRSGPTEGNRHMNRAQPLVTLILALAALLGATAASQAASQVQQSGPQPQVAAGSAERALLLGQAGRSLVEARYRWSRCLEGLDRLYGRLLGRSAA